MNSIDSNLQTALSYFSYVQHVFGVSTGYLHIIIPLNFLFEGIPILFQ